MRTTVDNLDAIVIGASAGGVRALSQILPHLRPNYPLPIAIVVHLPRDRPSQLASVLGSFCPMPVIEIEDKQPFEAGAVYLAPPDYHVLIDRGPVLALIADEPVMFSRPSIDVLFESAARYFRQRVLGIVLSGANADGAAGLAAIDAAGGACVVQAFDDAEASAMPEAAMRAAARAAPHSAAQIGALLANL